MDAQKSLQLAGLSQKEAQVYLAALELGEGTAQEIAQKAKIGRSTAYFVLEGLEDQDLITVFHRGKTKHFAAEDPKRLLDSSEEQYRAMNTAFPELKRIWGQSQNSSNISFLQDREEIKTMYEELLSEQGGIYRIFGTAEWMQEEKIWSTNYFRRRADAGVHVRLILEDTLLSREQFAIEQSLQAGAMKFIPSEALTWKELSSYVTITEDRVILHKTGRTPSVAIIYGREIAGMMTIWHEMAWKLL